MDTYLIQGSHEWHEKRRRSIGSSDIAPILGISPFMTRFQLWEVKLGYRTQYFSPAMARGKELEAEARIQFEEITGLEVFDSVLTHKVYSWKIGSFDGITLDLKIAVEIKCPSESTHKLSLSGIIPEYYNAQMQHLMDVANLPWMYYFSYHPDFEYALIKVERDQKFIDMAHAEAEIFLRHLHEEIPPPHFLKDHLDLSKDNEFTGLEELWLKEKSLQKVITENLKIIEEKLERLASGQSARGKKIKIDHVEKKGNIDYNALIVSLGDMINQEIIEKFRKETTTYMKISEIK